VHVALVEALDELRCFLIYCFDTVQGNISVAGTQKKSVILYSEMRTRREESLGEVHLILATLEIHSLSVQEKTICSGRPQA